MRIACVYSVDSAASARQPLASALEIPLGMAMIATVLKRAGHDVELFVLSPRSHARTTLERYIRERQPRLFCLTAASTRFPFMRGIAATIKSIAPSIFVVLGGHHASLAPEDAIGTPSIDALCVGEGEAAAVALADRLERGETPTGIPNLWLKQAGGAIERNAPAPLCEDLDSLPLIDRELWAPWIAEPGRFASVLLGRGCPFKCAYCANHAMSRLAPGRFVRFRSPESVVSEIEALCARYPALENVYLEVETIWANPERAAALLEALAAFNGGRARPVPFGVNATVTSALVRDEERLRASLAAFRRANVTFLNVGLESGSERVRRNVLRRPHYTNDELLRFARLAGEHGIALNWYVLIGVPGETLADYAETVRVCRAAQPAKINLSIYYPYFGTDLYARAVTDGLIAPDGLERNSERARPALDLPGFPARRIRREYILFWHRVYRGRRSPDRILALTARAFIKAYPGLFSLAKYLTTHNPVFRRLRDRYVPRSAQLAK